MSEFRKLPVVIEAIQTPLDAEKLSILSDWMGGQDIELGLDGIIIRTLEGEMTATKGDWIIKGVKGELYPCKPEIFAATYEAVDHETDLDPAKLSFHSWFSKAALDVTAERRRQVKSEKRTFAHDDEYTNGQLAKAAIAYAQRAAMSDAHRELEQVANRIPGPWPWSHLHWKPKDRRTDLVRAAALIIAEIERLDRAEGRS